MPVIALKTQLLTARICTTPQNRYDTPSLHHHRHGEIFYFGCCNDELLNLGNAYQVPKDQFETAHKSGRFDTRSPWSPQTLSHQVKVNGQTWRTTWMLV